MSPFGRGSTGTVVSYSPPLATRVASAHYPTAIRAALHGLVRVKERATGSRPARLDASRPHGPDGNRAREPYRGGGGGGGKNRRGAMSQFSNPHLLSFNDFKVADSRLPPGAAVNP